MKKQLFTITGFFFLLNLFSQQTVWIPSNSNLDPRWWVSGLSVVDTNIVWGLGYDGNAGARASNKFTHSIDGSNFTVGTFLADTNTYNVSNISAVSGTTAFISLYNKAAAGAAGKIIATTDGGTSWHLISDTTTMFAGASNYPNAVHFYNSNLGWAWGDPNPNYFEFYRTKNGGANWTRVPSTNMPNPLANEYGLSTSYAVNGQKFIWFGTTLGRIYRSADSGNTWHASTIPNMTNGAYGIAFRDSVNGLAWGYNAANIWFLARTTDGGNTWLATPHNGPSIGQGDICVVPGKNAYMSVGKDSSGMNALTSVTYDDANTWNILETGPSGYITASIWVMIDAQMLDSAHGWAGSITTSGVQGSPGGLGIDKYNGPVITTVGISTISKNIQVAIYPNPSNGNFIIETNITEIQKLQIFDVAGKMILSQNINGKTNIDASSLDNGMYFIQIKTSETIYKQKIIVQH